MSTDFEPSTKLALAMARNSLSLCIATVRFRHVESLRSSLDASKSSTGGEGGPFFKIYSFFFFQEALHNATTSFESSLHLKCLEYAEMAQKNEYWKMHSTLIIRLYRANHTND